VCVCVCVYTKASVRCVGVCPTACQMCRSVSVGFRPLQSYSWPNESFVQKFIMTLKISYFCMFHRRKFMSDDPDFSSGRTLMVRSVMKPSGCVPSCVSATTFLLLRLRMCDVRS
jgi:hypothetical protein